MSKDQADKQPLNFPRPGSPAPRPPQASEEEYVDFIQVILEMTSEEEADRQKQSEDQPTMRFRLKV